MRLPEFRPRLPLLGVAGSALIGIAAADVWQTNAIAPIALAAMLGLAAFFRPRTVLLWAAVTATFFALHTLRHYGSEGALLAGIAGPEPVVATATGIVWSEPEKPHTWSRNTTCHFLLRLETLRLGNEERATSALVQVRWAGAVPQYGDEVTMLGSLHPLEPVRNPGQFDFPAWQQRQGISLQMQSRYAADCRIVSQGHGLWTQRIALASQHWIRRCLEIDLQDAPEISSLIESMILGAHGETGDDIRDLFQRTGTMHLFAVSGFNVALLAVLAWYLLKIARCPRRIAIFVIIPLLGLYALITGLSASCVRASLTGSFLLAGFLCDRRPPALNSVCAAALIILAVDTEQLFSTGFQFSFAVVVCLLLCASPLHRWLRRLAQPDPYLPDTLWSWRQRSQVWAWGHASSMLSVNFIGWAGSLSFTVGYFHLFSPAALLANLIAVPISCAILWLGVGSLAAGSVSTTLAGLFNNANWLLSKALLLVLSSSVAIPGSYSYLRPAPPSRAACAVTVLDTGTGAAIHLHTGGADWMIDCAHGYEYGQVVRPYLQARGVNRLDGLILTHGDAQHVGGALALLTDFQPRLILDSPLRDRSSARKMVQTTLAEREQPKRLIWRGDSVTLSSSAKLRVLFPPPGLARSSADDKTLVLLLETGSGRVLFTSDSGFATENWLLENEPELHADVLVKGQHAKDLSGTPDFLLRVQPQLIVSAMPELSASPAEHEGWMRAVAEEGIALFPQERTGAVELSLQAGEIRARAWLGGQTFRSRAR